MKTQLVKISEKPFVRNVVIVATGTAAAQAITMAFSPIIARLYGPEVFGVQGVFMAIVAIVAPIAAMTYPIAIVLPKSDTDAKVLIRISLYISLMIAVLTALILILFNNHIVSLLQIEDIAPYLYLIPLVILFSASLQIAQQWLIRTKQFSITARVTFLQALFLNSAKAGIGWFNPVASILIILSTLGSALHALMLIISASRSKYKHSEELYKSATVIELVKQYRDFPLFRAPQVFINAISQSLPVLLLASFFGPSSAGFYTIGRTVLAMPTQLIGNSVGDVLYPRISEAANNGENLTRLITRATLALVAVGIIPFGIVMVSGPWLFEFVFGVEWILAGEYARWLALWLFFMFINKPSVIAIPVLKLQGKFLIYEIFSISSKVIALLIGFYLLNNDILTVVLYSLTGVIAYVYLIIWVIKSSKNFSGV